MKIQYMQFTCTLILPRILEKEASVLGQVVAQCNASIMQNTHKHTPVIVGINAEFFQRFDSCLYSTGFK